MKLIHKTITYLIDTVGGCDNRWNKPVGSSPLCAPLPPTVNLLLPGLSGEIVLVESHDLLDRALNGLNQADAVIAQLTSSVEQTPQVSGFTPIHFLMLT